MQCHSVTLILPLTFTVIDLSLKILSHDFNQDLIPGMFERLAAITIEYTDW